MQSSFTTGAHSVKPDRLGFLLFLSPALCPFFAAQHSWGSAALSCTKNTITDHSSLQQNTLERHCTGFWQSTCSLTDLQSNPSSPWLDLRCTAMNIEAGVVFCPLVPHTHWNRQQSTGLNSATEDMLALTRCQDHIFTENIWFVWSKTSYSRDKRRFVEGGCEVEALGGQWEAPERKE